MIIGGRMSGYTAKPDKPVRVRYRAALAAIVIFVTAFAFEASAQDVKQKKFKSPEAAFKALTEAARTSDVKGLLAIFGPDAKELISSGDAVADRAAREKFVKAAAEAVKFSRLDEKTVLPVIGNDSCSFPIPIVRSGKGWVFATEDGKQEIINRRIGKNELHTIRVSREYLQAQSEYAAMDRTGDGTLQYAQRFRSRPGKKDGLYWEAASGQEMSPLGLLFARATEEGYSPKEKGWKRIPYHGYFFRILKSQGDNAPGGEKDYVVDGRMTDGFGLLAYPAEYGVSGIMTFIVNREGIIYQKDLGPDTKDVAKTISKYDPDKTWRIVK
jgi:hypothetical protein